MKRFLIYISMLFYPITSKAVYMDFKPSSLEGTSSVNSNSIMVSVIAVIDWVLTFTGFIAVVLLIYAGIMMMFKSGNAEEAGKYKMYVVSISIGLLIILMSYAFVSWILAPSTAPVFNPNQQL